MGLNKNQTNKTFVSIVSGTIRQRVEKDTEGAKMREIETRDGATKIVYELNYDSLDGYIQSMSFKDTDFGKMFNIEIDGIVLSLNTESRYFQDLAKKLPNIDLKKPVLLIPYDFESDNKRLTGVSIQQNNEKIQNYFYDGEKNLHNFPTPEGDTSEYDSDDWKIYFTKVKKFLVNYIENMPKEYRAEPEDTSYEDEHHGVPEIKHESKIDPPELPFS